MTEYIEYVLKTIERLGALTPAAIFALYSAGASYYIYNKHKDDKKETLERLRAWEEATKAEERQTAVIAKLSETVLMLTQGHNVISEKVSQILIVLDERLPRIRRQDV